MWLLRALVLLGLLSASLAAQMRLTVQQLSSFIESSLKLKHPDRQVAEYLKRVKLTEQLDDRTIETWLGSGIGPRTLDALRLLADASKDLPKATPPAPKPPPVLIPPPSEDEQRRILAHVREYATGYSKRLPDFICLQVTRRFHDPTGLEFWRSMDTIAERLTYFNQKEDYKVISVNGRPTVIPVDHDRLGGATSSGEFGSMMKEIFDPETEALFRWERWGTLRGHRNHVFFYQVSQAKSKWTIDFNRVERIVPAYRGLIYVEADTLTVTKITLEAIDIPPSFPIQQARTTLDYDFAKIGETDHVLPLRAEVRMREGKNLIKNEVEFRRYQKFGADATIKFDTPEPLPEDATKEQPVRPPPNK